MKKIDWSQEEFNAEVRKIPAWVSESRNIKSHYFKTKADCLMYKTVSEFLEEKIRAEHKHELGELLNDVTVIYNKFYSLYSNFEENQSPFQVEGENA